MLESRLGNVNDSNLPSYKIAKSILEQAHQRKKSQEKVQRYLPISQTRTSNNSNYHPSFQERPELPKAPQIIERGQCLKKKKSNNKINMCEFKLNDDKFYLRQRGSPINDNNKIQNQISYNDKGNLSPKFRDSQISSRSHNLIEEKIFDKKMTLTEKVESKKAKKTRPQKVFNDNFPERQHMFHKRNDSSPYKSSLKKYDQSDYFKTMYNNQYSERNVLNESHDFKDYELESYKVTPSYLPTKIDLHFANQTPIQQSHDQSNHFISPFKDYLKQDSNINSDVVDSTNRKTQNTFQSTPLNFRGPSKKQTSPNIDILQPGDSDFNSSVNNSIIMPTNQSTGFFSKVKSFFKNSEISTHANEEYKRPSYVRHNFECECGPSSKSYACKNALQWLNCANNSEFDYEKNKALYQDLLKFNEKTGSEYQIERDITRTFPSRDNFHSGSEGQKQLQRVLQAFSKYDQSIGYVQGMNFIVGSLLYHCTEEIAFWLFVSLIEDYELRDIYQPKLPGLYKHSQVLLLLQMEHLHKIFQHFCQHKIQVEMYASDWIFALFSNVIPFTKFHHFLNAFFQHGWIFFYKFSLTFLKALEEHILDAEDFSEILTIIKIKQSRNGLQVELEDTEGEQSPFSNIEIKSEFMQSRREPSQHSNRISIQVKNMFNKYIYGRELELDPLSFRDESVWERIIQVSLREWEKQFNEDYIMVLLQNFDNDNLVFNQIALERSENTHKLNQYQRSPSAPRRSSNPNQDIFISPSKVPFFQVANKNQRNVDSSTQYANYTKLQDQVLGSKFLQQSLGKLSSNGAKRPKEQTTYLYDNK